MSSESDTPNTETDSPNTGVLVTIVAVGALAMIGISLAVTALVRYEVDVNESEKGARANVRPYREARADWEQKLNAPPAWVKRGQTVSLPIERAMQLTLSDLQKNPALATPARAATADAGTQTAPAPTGEAGAAAEDGGIPAEPTPEGAAAQPGSPTPAPEGKTPAKPAPKPAPAQKPAPASKPAAPAPKPAAPPAAPAPAPAPTPNP